MRLGRGLAVLSFCLIVPVWGASAGSGITCRTEISAPNPDDNPPTEVTDRRVTANDPCAVADDNLARTEAEILRPQPTAAISPQAKWDHKTKPQFLHRITQRFDLQPAELSVLNRIGFAVPQRLAVPSYAYGYHEIFQSQLPVYVTTDSIFHAVFASHKTIVQRLEEERLSPLLERALEDLHCALAAAAAAYPATVSRDLDLYLLVARRLMANGDAPRSALADAGVEHEAEDLVARITASGELASVSLFGRERVIDFTQYQPRGHYGHNDLIKRYFHAAMWASRLEFNLISRSSRSSAPGDEPDPRETPREALAALALADLAKRSGADRAIGEIDAAWTFLAGIREDVSIAQLHVLGGDVGPLSAPEAFDKLKAAIGDRFKRTTRLHPMPQGSTHLPVIATLIGPRIVDDAGALTLLVNGAVPGRDRLGLADVAYTLGFEPAKAYLEKDLAAYPALAGQLEAARAQVAAAPPRADLYSAWLGAIGSLAQLPDGRLPSYMSSKAGEELRFNTIAAAYGQLKHNYVLVAGQPYAEFGCEIPDGYVEPAPEAYAALAEYAARGARLAALLDPEGSTRIAAHFKRVGQVLRVLQNIATAELSGRALTGAERRWLGMVAELNINLGVDTTGHPPMYTGWYFDLFFAREEDGMRGAEFIADYYTSQQGVAYAGATAPRLAIFVVDVGGPPRAFVGPVARAYGVQGPLGTRHTDDTARALVDRDEPWARSYTIAAPATPPSLQVHYDAQARQIVLTSDRALGPASIKTLDHHRTPLDAIKVAVRKGETRIPVHRKAIAGLMINVGAFRDVVVADAYGNIKGQWGIPPPEPR